MNLKNNELGYNKPNNNNGSYDVSVLLDEGFIYGENNIAKHLSKKSLKINAIGDSIGGGTAALSNRGFLSLFNESYEIENNVNRILLTLFNDSNLTTDTSGLGLLNKRLATSKSFKVPQFNWLIPQYDYQIKIVYSTRIDGGSFEVKAGETVLGTYSCNGENMDGIETGWINVPAKTAITISNSSENNCYLNFYYIRNATWNEMDTICFSNFSTGGLKVADYPSVDTVLDTCFYGNPDILIWEIGNNDYSNGTLDKYKEYLEAVAIRAKEIGVELIIITCCRNSQADIDGNITKTRFEVYKEFNLSIAKQYNYCHIDYDLLFGGYTNAHNNNLIADSIHPNGYGHTLMADVLCKIFGITNCVSRGMYIDTSDTRYNYGYTDIDKTLWFKQQAIFNNVKTKISDNNGNQAYTNLAGIFTHHTIAALPKYARLGAIAIIGNGIYVNTADCTDSFNVLAVWRPLITVATATASRPTNNNATGTLLFDTSLNKLLVWRNNGWYDILGNADNTTYVKKSDYDAKIAELESKINSLTGNE